jgi:lipid-binding SYLF domain-containing protein
MKLSKIGILVAIAMISPMVSFAEDTDQPMRARMGQSTESADFHKMVDRASEVYSALVKGPHGEVPPSVMKAARCIAVIPNVITGALLVGGAHGKGLASCKDNDNDWSQPAPISLSQGSLGLQAGAKSTDLVLFFQSQEAVTALKRGKFALGTDVSVAAGRFDRNLDTTPAGVLAYSRTEGAFAGISINGSTIGKADDELASYYGKQVNYASLLEGQESPDRSEYTEKLTKLFPED